MGPSKAINTAAGAGNAAVGSSSDDSEQHEDTVRACVRGAARGTLAIPKHSEWVVDFIAESILAGMRADSCVQFALHEGYAHILSITASNCRQRQYFADVMNVHRPYKSAEMHRTIAYV